MIVLLIEDDERKLSNIESFFGILEDITIVKCGSVNSAVSLLRSSKYDLIVTDMSLPTFEIGPREKGGRPQGFGGREVMRQMKRIGIDTPVIVITQYATFDGPNEYMELEDLQNQLQKEHSGNYCGLVYYNSAFDKWKDELYELLSNIDSVHISNRS